MRAVLLGLVLGVAGLPVHAQRAPNPTLPEQFRHAPAITQKMRELACREQAARDMQKPVALPPGATRAWELERVQRERLCLEKGDAPNVPAGRSAQTQRAPNPAQPERSFYAPVSSQKMRELVCREQAARDMQKPVTLPPGATRAWELERVQREQLCLARADASNDAGRIQPLN